MCFGLVCRLQPATAERCNFDGPRPMAARKAAKEALALLQDRDKEGLKHFFYHLLNTDPTGPLLIQLGSQW